MVKKRRRHSAACKFRTALEAIESTKTMSQLSSAHKTFMAACFGPGHGACRKTGQVSSTTTTDCNGEPRSLDQETGKIKCIQTDASARRM